MVAQGSSQATGQSSPSPFDLEPEKRWCWRAGPVGGEDWKKILMDYVENCTDYSPALLFDEPTLSSTTAYNPSITDPAQLQPLFDTQLRTYIHMNTKLYPIVVSSIKSTCLIGSEPTAVFEMRYSIMAARRMVEATSSGCFRRLTSQVWLNRQTSEPRWQLSSPLMLRAQDSSTMH